MARLGMVGLGMIGLRMVGQADDDHQPGHQQTLPAK
jgi:hypothetical protein